MVDEDNILAIEIALEVSSVSTSLGMKLNCHNIFIGNLRNNLTGDVHMMSALRGREGVSQILTKGREVWCWMGSKIPKIKRYVLVRAVKFSYTWGLLF